MLIEWREAWLLGEDRIDAEHLAMVSIINALHGAVSRGEGREAVTAILRSLLERTQEHFAYEESLMAATGYPGADIHHEQHHMLLGLVAILVQNRELVDDEIVLGTIGFFDDWFISHVETDDAAFGRYLAGRVH
ncbi:MAG: hemerythrin family protein [Rhodospirillaceae bacterium]